MSYVHIPGVSNVLADRLSRAHMSEKMYSEACQLVLSMNLKLVVPVTDVLNKLVPSIRCRSGAVISADNGDREAVVLQGTGHMEQPQKCSQDIPSILSPPGARPCKPTSCNDVRLHRVHKPPCEGPSNNSQHSVSRPSVHQSCRVQHPGGRAPTSHPGGRGTAQEQVIHTR